MTGGCPDTDACSSKEGESLPTHSAPALFKAIAAEKDAPSSTVSGYACPVSEGVFDEAIVVTEGNHTASECTVDGATASEAPAADETSASDRTDGGDASVVVGPGSPPIPSNGECHGKVDYGKPVDNRGGNGCSRGEGSGNVVEDDLDEVDASGANAWSSDVTGYTVMGGEVVEETKDQRAGGHGLSPRTGPSSGLQTLSSMTPIKPPASLPTAVDRQEAQGSIRGEPVEAVEGSVGITKEAGAGGNRLDVDAFREGRKKCEDRFAELMSDERTR